MLSLAVSQTGRLAVCSPRRAVVLHQRMSHLQAHTCLSDCCTQVCKLTRTQSPGLLSSVMKLNVLACALLTSPCLAWTGCLHLLLVIVTQSSMLLAHIVLMWQGMLVTEMWMDRVASVTKQPLHSIRQLNLYQEKDRTHFGQILHGSQVQVVLIWL